MALPGNKITFFHPAADSNLFVETNEKGKERGQRGEFTKQSEPYNCKCMPADLMTGCTWDCLMLGSMCLEGSSYMCA